MTRSVKDVPHDHSAGRCYPGCPAWTDPEAAVEPAPTVAEVKASLDELHYQARNMAEPWLLDAERQMRWLLAEYLRPTIQDDDSEPSAGIA